MLAVQREGHEPFDRLTLVGGGGSGAGELGDGRVLRYERNLLNEVRRRARLAGVALRMELETRHGLGSGCALRAT